MYNKENLDLIIKVIGGKKLKNHSIKFLKRINNDGSNLIDIKSQPKKICINAETVKINCLSITHKKYIAFFRGSSYIVEVIDNETGEKLPYINK